MSLYNVSMTARLAAQASPSVSIEKGTYRMRTPSSHPQPRMRRRIRDTSSATIERQMALLVVFLICATIASFGTAYYLFTTRWATRAVHPALHPSDAPLHQAALGGTESPQRSTFLPLSGAGVGSGSGFESGMEKEPVEGERYLSYLPHSGFHNQRIAFENALVLSRLLNRTLLVPPVRLGNKPLSYVPFDELRELLVNDTKVGLERCADLPFQLLDDEWTQRCEAYAEYTHVPWDWLVDLAPIRKEQRLLQRWNFTDAWLQEHLHVDANATFALRDTNRTDYGFQDFAPPKRVGAALKRKYTHALHLSALARRPERLVQLGTLFGSSRLHLRDRGNTLIRGNIRKSMAFANPQLMAAADAVRDALGGTYLGAHVRLGDGFFLDRGEANVRLIWWKLLYALNFTTEEISGLERRLFAEESPWDGSELSPPHILPDIPALRVPHPPQVVLPAVPHSKLTCPGPLHTRAALLNTPLFIATDAPAPRTDPLLARFTRTFPCTFFLADFPPQTAPLDALRGRDGVPLRAFVLPFLEAMVAGRAWSVVGTEGSTFSSFVEDVLWRTYHGWEIVQRG